MEGIFCYGFINLGHLDLICNLALPRLSGIKGKHIQDCKTIIFFLTLVDYYIVKQNRSSTMYTKQEDKEVGTRLKEAGSQQH